MTPADGDPTPGPAPRTHRSPLLAVALILGGLLLGVVATWLLMRPTVRESEPEPARTSSIGTPGPGWQGEDTDPVAYATGVVDATNAARDAEGLPALAMSACATQQAATRAAALVGAELEHASLQGVLAACAPSTTAAENLSRGAADPAQVVEAWLGSPEHRANLLDADLTDVGVSCRMEAGEMLCAQVFLGP